MLWSEGTTVDYFERSLHSAAEIKPRVCAELIYGHGVERLQCTASSWDGMRGKGSRRAEACLLIGRIFVTSFNRNRESPPGPSLFRDRRRLLYGSMEGMCRSAVRSMIGRRRFYPGGI